VFDAATADLLAEMLGSPVVCINPRGFRGLRSLGIPSLYQMVDQIEEVRRYLGFGRWIFWGMSGGGWLAQIYARRYAEALTGVVIESACLCFRERLSDPACVLSPFFPAWRDPLRRAELLSESSHIGPAASDDTEWQVVDGVGPVFRRRDGPALLVSPGPISPEMKCCMPHFWEFDSRPWIRAVRVPSLVICGTADPVVPLRHSRAIHEAIPGSIFAEIEGAGHVPIAQKNPEVSTAFKKFVSTVMR
jgi:proline iminopeptidase